MLRRGTSSLLSRSVVGRSQYPTDRRTTRRARWRRQPSAPPRWSTTVTRWAPPRLGARLHGPARPTTPRRASSQTSDAGAAAGSGAKPQPQRGVPPGMGAMTGHLQAEALHHRLRLHGGLYRALGRRHTAVPRRPDQQLDALRTRGRQQVVAIGFPVTNADKAGLGTPVLRTAHRRQTGEPLLAFLLADGQLRTPGALAHVVGVTGPHVLG